MLFDVWIQISIFTNLIQDVIDTLLSISYSVKSSLSDWAICSLCNSKSESDDLFIVDINEEVEATPKTTINAAVVQAMKQLQTSYNNDAKKIVEQAALEKVPRKI